MQALLSDTKLKNELTSHGLDVDSILAKYATNDREVMPAKKTTIVEDESSDQLDNLKICFRCNGTGYMKESYNYQVREVNCVRCKGEGLLAAGQSN